MQRTVILSLIFAVTAATPADARLFWQTYGSTIPAQGNSVGGGGCTWNWNQDYFVPRYASTCRYDLFSPCKVGRTRSPAAKNCSQIYPGYCTVFTACRYRWRNHVYKAYCGCAPLKPYCGPWRNTPCRRGCGALRSSANGLCSAEPCESCGGLGGVRHFDPSAYGFLPGVEPAGLELLGSIPVDSEDLLASGVMPIAPASGDLAIPVSPVDQSPALQQLLESQNTTPPPGQ